MPIVSAKCTNCGANLNVENTKDAAICEFCGSAFVVEKAINNYNVTNHISNNISGSVVNINGGNAADFIIRAGKLEKYTGAGTTVVIPNGVVEIGYKAFSGCSGITSVTIPNSVTSIGSYAFHGCSGLSSIELPDGVKVISSEAFYGCSGLSSVIIPDSVLEIGEHAFWYCKGLKSVKLSESMKTINGAIFIGCGQLKSLTIPNGVTELGSHGIQELAAITIPDSVEVIGEQAFLGCKNLTSITIPNGVKSIEFLAFSGCKNLTSLIVPNSVKSIKEKAFEDCPLTNVNQDFLDRCYRIKSVNWSSLSGIEEHEAKKNAIACEREKGNFEISQIGLTSCTLPIREVVIMPKKSGCYLTTACMEHQPQVFDDNCHELTVLRGFRDTYLAENHPEDIQTYYRSPLKTMARNLLQFLA